MLPALAKILATKLILERIKKQLEGGSQGEKTESPYIHHINLFQINVDQREMTTLREARL